MVRRRRLHLDISEGYKNGLTLSIYWGIRAFMLLAIIAFIFRGQYATALGTTLILFVMVIPSILKERYRLYLPFALDLGIAVFVFLTLFLGEVARFYEYIPFFDKFLHFQSGLILGAVGYLIIYLLNEHERFDLNLSPGFITLFAITFSLAIGVVWEMGEFVGDWMFDAYWQGYNVGNADTMWDLIADLAGALIVSVPGYFWMYRHKRLPLTPWLLRLTRSARETLGEEV